MVAERAVRPEGSGLPKGWRVVKFGEMAQSVNDRVDNPAEAGVDRYVGLEHLDPDTLHLHRWGLPTDVEATKLRFKPGDIIFGRRRAYQRKLAVADFEGICSAHALVLRARPETVEPRYLPVFMQSNLFFKRALEISVGSLSPTINWKTLAVQPFPLPPREEQRRIADILWAADAAVECWREVGDASERVFSSALKSLTSLDYPSVELGSVADVVYGLTINAARRKMPITRPYLRVANVQRGTLDLSELKEVGCTEAELRNYTLEFGDILVVEGHANISEIGRSALWRGATGDCLHQNHVLRVRPLADLSPEYVTLYLNSRFGRAYFRRNGKSTSGLNTINSTVLKGFPLPLPSPAQQADIVRVTSSIQDGIHAANKSIGVLTTAKAALMASLLEGNDV